MLSLTSCILEIKSFYQPIEDMIFSGNDINGKKLKVIFSQEAASIFTSSTKVYLKWHHQELDIQGYNVFNCIEVGDKTLKINPVWEIAWPSKMIQEGHIICKIEKVDNNSLIGTDDFQVTISADPIDLNKFIASDDYNLFSQAAIVMNQSVEDIARWLEEVELEGVTDYLYVTNKPSINGVELTGNQTLEDFGFRAITDDEIEEIVQGN